MLPYFIWTSIDLGVIKIQIWGLFVALGCLAAILIAFFRAKRLNLNSGLILDLSFWVLASALIGGRIFFIVQNLDYYLAQGWEIFKLWEGGMAISGGFIGAVLAAVIFLRYKKVEFWKYCEVAVFALPLGLGIGRIGCFLIFDHPGTVTTFILGQKYIDGLVRHNHGLYLSLAGFMLFGIFLLLDKFVKNRKIFLTPIFLIYDGLVRLVLDFFRIQDPTWFGLTAAQYLGIISIILGIIILAYKTKKHPSFN